MIVAIIKEIDLTPLPEEERTYIETIYFGGGTPGILETSDIAKIVAAIKLKFTISAEAEITLEANPDDITKEKIQQWKDIGINRLSLGIQSFDEAELFWMNRAHDAKKALESLEAIRASGISNYSADLIYGSPLQTDSILQENIKTMISQKVPHLSCYALTVEKGTALHKNIERKLQPDIDEDVQARHFEILFQELSAAGYEQYEISNFSLPGYRSRHNSNYWKGIPYYGFGPSAHSYNGTDRRNWNVANNALYIRSVEKNVIPFEEEILTPEQMQNENVMVAIRTIEGIDLGSFAEKFGDLALKEINKKATKFINENLLEENENHLRLTPKGKFLADGIASDLFI